MPKYLVLYRSSQEALQQMATATPEQAQEGMQAWMSWAQQTGSSLVDLGSPVGMSRTIAGGTDTGLPVCGFSILDTNSIDAATKLCDDHPHLHAPGAAIEILEYLPLPGM